METKTRLLIVDDEKLNIAGLVEALREEYSINVAMNGPDALRIASEEPRPDLILLDVNMPGMSGFEVCEALQADAGTAAIPVIFVTTQSDTSSEELGLLRGAVDYIHKPIEPALVRLRVRTHIRLKLQTEFLRKMFDRQSMDMTEAREQIDALLRFISAK